MPHVSASIKYRPLRVGFLVREGEIGDLRAAAQLNTLLWGGIYNPMIPVSSEGVVDRELIDSFAVDMLIASAKAPELEAVLEQNPFLTNHEVSSELLYEDWTTKKQVVSLLDSLCIVERWWHESFRHAGSAPESRCALLEWDMGDDLSTCLTLAFGLYPTHLNLRDDFAGGFEEGLKARKLSFAIDGDLPAEMSGLVSPLFLTGVDLLTYGGPTEDMDGVFLGNANSATDLLGFWNLRAWGVGVQFIPRSSPQRFRGFLQKYFDNLQEREPGQHPLRSHGTITLHYTDCPEDERNRFCDAYAPGRSIAHLRLGDRYTPEWRSSQHYLSYESATGLLERHDGVPSISLDLPPKKFLVDERHRPRRQGGFDLLAVSIDFFSDSSFEGYTLRPPYIRALDEFYGREIAFDPWDVRCERDGIALIIRLSASTLYLKPLSHQVLIERIFRLAGIGATVSQPGRIARTIIKKMRERQPLDACRVFKVRGVRVLLARMTAAEVVNSASALRDIGSAGFDSFKGLYIESRRKRTLEPQDVLAFLLKKRILRPVIQADREREVPFRCGECGLKTTVPRGAFEATWHCPHCGEAHFMPACIMLLPHVHLPPQAWGVAKAGLFARDNNQEGAVPVLLTLMTLMRILDFWSFVYSPAMNLSFRTKCETDLAVLQFRHQEHGIELGIGECKSVAGRIDPNDVAKLKAARARAETAGIRTYLIFAKPADAFEPEELEQFRALWEEGVPTILFTNKELEPYDPFFKEHDDLVERHPFTFAALARNSRARYLGHRRVRSVATVWAPSPGPPSNEA